MSNAAPLLMLLCVMLFSAARGRSQSPSPPLEAAAAEFFIGQVYPSGNVYLKSFSADDSGARWPAVISVIGVTARTEAKSKQVVRFAEVLEDREVAGQVRSLYIPGAEGMDVQHASCGLGAVASANTVHIELTDDFFRAISDHCEPNKGVARYLGAGTNWSSLVFGSTERLQIVDVTIPSAVLRPLTAAEAEKVGSERAAEPAGCTTKPAYLDSARQLLEGTFLGNLRFRLSTYVNPGCAGHLTQIYILDLIRNTAVIETFQVRQYQGAL